jgi:hypothetical protein
MNRLFKSGALRAELPCHGRSYSPQAVSRTWVVVIGSLALAGCGYAAVHTAPKKQATTRRSAAAIQADEVFWKTFHGGAYDEIPKALDIVTAAYLQDPSDAVTAAHVGWLHMWRVAERSRLAPASATITDQMLLAQQRETRRGYYELLDAIDAWPEFNLFTAGYVMSQQPPDSARFRQGLEWQWRNADVCAEAKVDRTHPDYAVYMALATTQGKKRACWNSWIAPHNLEGFFLNMGDMLVASGDWQTAQVIYANARLSATYANWEYKDVLEQRIVNAQSNVAIFRGPQAGTSPARSSPRLMIFEDFACMGCHRE